MSSTVGLPAHSAVDVVHALDLLTSVDLDALDTSDLRLLTGRLLQVGHRTDAATLRVLHQLDRRGVAVERGRTSTAAWLRAVHRLHPATATRSAPPKPCTTTRPAPWSRTPTTG